MSKHKALTGAIAALASVATLGALAAPALAADTTYSPNGKPVAELAKHGGAQRIATIGNKNAKNVILFLGDGMGDSEITVARDYLKGANGHFDGLDAVGQPSAFGDVQAGTGQYTTFSVGNGSKDSAVGKDDDGKLVANPNPGKLTPVTDSSASGSAWATGTKTYNNAVDVDIYGNPQLNLFELAKAAGKATGNVTTAEIQDATPAVLESHSTERGCYGPQGKTDGTSNNASKQCLINQLKENGGIGSISEQLLDTRADVTIGGGSKYFRQTVQGGEYAGKTVWEQAKEMGYQTVENDPAAMNALEYKEGQPVLALMSDGNMPTKFNPSKATAQDPAKDANPTVCTMNDKWLGNQGSSLADMTKKALDLLEANPASDANGYFLQVEGASIDKQDHAGNACGQIGETDDFDQAIAYAMKNVDLTNTLVIVTADHAHTSQILNAQPAYALSTVLKTADGNNMVVSYGTAEADSRDEDGGYNGGDMAHTGTQLRIAASGPGAQRVIGLTDQTDNFYTIANTLGLASTSDDQKSLSNDAKTEVKLTDGKYVAESTGFNGDAVLSYGLKDKSGNVLAASDSSTPVSGVRVKTAQTTSIALDKVAEGNEYTLTVTGRQSGKTVTVDFQAPARDSSDEKPGDGKNDVIASGKVSNNPKSGVLGNTGAAITIAALAIAMLAAIAMIVKTAKISR
ncbi:alkaline phosphatase [Bifidobacterium adolescentis]|uniref:alkaline phosphatase n=2 Tax=Bifidobacterium adolescentis TaxID=1680 RepID=UPI00232B5BC6|nr:alkaline phosphatase [Bifidobacterium adolescentis]MDB1420918.1 alkaline phosphatase [Bifidobacterium adolescentis]MDB1422494.1 alkaline phosphatase [Bifidobacterium adolescentis]MDB1426107.1 alkaline phosphatase [Bifidobacterium adolescentis]MDB1427905.1 alkaline phosphatase [Bifidobacterium adolescentis]